MQFMTHLTHFITKLYEITFGGIIMQPTQKLAASNNISICAVNWPKIVHTKIAEENIMKIKNFWL